MVIVMRVDMVVSILHPDRLTKPKFILLDMLRTLAHNGKDSTTTLTPTRINYWAMPSMADRPHHPGKKTQRQSVATVFLVALYGQRGKLE